MKIEKIGIPTRPRCSMNKTRKTFINALLLLALLSLAFSASPIAQAWEEDKLAISVPFTSITTERKTINVPLEVRNDLNRSLIVSFEISCPARWRYSLIFQGYNVSEIFLKPDETMSLNLRLEPSEEVKEGSYSFTIRAFSGDIVSNKIGITVNILKPIEEVELEAASLSVTGTPGSTFTFRFDVVNRGYRDLTFALSAIVPSDWRLLGFRPSIYEKRAISEITVKAQSTTRGVVVEAWCPREIPPKEYPITIAIVGEGIEKSLEFTAVVTGTHEVSLRTQEELLSYGVNAGESKEITLIVENEGTADLRDVKISCSAPYGWKAVVSPEGVDILPVGESVSVSLTISPPAGTIAGDYSVTARVRTPESSDEIKLRITVTKPTLWGIIGAVVVVASILGLMLVFRKYGRP
ncbi:MAG: NEW3 domain-containing protein [Candidatus Bathyarchaeia archaeon]